MNNSLPDKLSTFFDPIFQEAIDEAVEQHRVNGESIAVSENGKVKIVSPQDITPLSEKINYSPSIKAN